MIGSNFFLQMIGSNLEVTKIEFKCENKYHTFEVYYYVFIAFVKHYWISFKII
jgi:hypothetical protein